MSAYLYGGLGGAVLVLAGLLWWQGGRLERVRAEFTAFKAAQAQLMADVTKAAQIKSQAVESNNAQVMADLQGKLDGSVADSTRLAVRLRDALAHPHASPVPASTGQPGTAPASGGAGGDSTLEATAAAFAACERDGSRLDALIEQIKPQL